MKRNSLGQMVKSLVRIGDIATIDKTVKVLGVTEGRAYKVIATYMSTERNNHVPYGKCETPRHFIIINDYGERTLCSLSKNDKYAVQTDSIFGRWTITETPRK